MLNYSTLSFKSDIESKYLGEKVISWNDLTFVIPNDYSFEIFVVTDEYIARPDLISYDTYGDTMFADVICKLNGISNPFELNEGMKIIVPHPEDILNFVLHPIKKAVDTNVSDDQSIIISANPKKQKREKRQANEAIVGDERFRIDRNSRIIIY